MSDGDPSNPEGATPTESEGTLSAREQRAAVRARYGAIARGTADQDGTDGEGGCCGDEASVGESRTESGCYSGTAESAADGTKAERLGYSTEEIEAVADGANLGLGCGNPGALAGLEAGETVLDLGSGAGFDCFLAAREVGPGGRVIGVDMTPEMVERARENATRNDAGTVDFRLGEIEHLPVADGSVDVVISNCVINLSLAKPQVFAEAFRVLRPGGRLAVSDVVLTAPVPSDLRVDPESVAGCVAGAATVEELEAMLVETGFEDVAIEPKDDSREFISEWSDERDLSAYVVSATIEGRKPHEWS